MKITNPVGFRISVLWKGIVLLQESKFLCDSLENSLRTGIHRHCVVRDIPLKNVLSSRLTEAKRNKRKPSRSDDLLTRFDEDKPISLQYLQELSFGEIKNLVLNNWNVIGEGISARVGFADLFWNARACRDKNLFKLDFKYIVDARNRISHSKNLFEEYEVQRLFLRIERWSVPLDIGVASRIARYRKSRRDFLSEIAIVEEPRLTFFDNRQF